MKIAPICWLDGMGHGYIACRTPVEGLKIKVGIPGSRAKFELLRHRSSGSV